MVRVAVSLALVSVALAASGCRSSSAPPAGAVDATDDGPNASDGAGDDACVIPSMIEQYPGSGLPTPHAPGILAPACVATRHDAILVLGCPNADDGGPSDCQSARADIAVALMDAGYGDRFITSGAAVHNAWVEADTLASLLVARGVPDASVLRETRAKHTDENVFFATEIMGDHGFTTALVVSDDPSHLELVAVCDSNCCVKLGRLTVFDFLVPDGDGGRATVKAGHYERYPGAAPVSAAECQHIEQPSKLMCIALPGRLACAGRDAGGD